MWKKIALAVLSIIGVLFGAYEYKLGRIVSNPSEQIQYLTMDNADISGSTLLDISGSNNLVLYNSPLTGESGVYGQSVLFNGTSQYAKGGSAVSPDSSYTLTLWFKTTAVNNRIACVNTWELSGPSGLCIAQDAAYVKVLAEGKAWGGGTTSANDGSWHFAALTRDDKTNTNKLYIDNNLVSTLVKSPNEGNNLMLAAGWYSGVVNYYNGYIDDARVFGRALSAEEISQLYNYTKHNKIWRLNSSLPSAVVFH